ncbi:hypothetical protein ALP73_03087 [Pseudomonas coronafaciens pv. garcae]|uniref:DUF4124 domain-containing protein n=4 Tax=Pseudomonas syringae group TaxID=136849 RepID=A0AB37QUM4_9PSED|nr:hypothetical protein ALQ71_00082 [Pseudomonas coronafaciens pv. striafaciens]RMN27355.1 TonB-related protein [Pseudomonas coronafaciens pv. zizaniae]RMP21879.1 hypothetical protein ALQ25_03110 [Pseudomonas coronafaciens pv. atropurpurea]RMS03664.1 hypothetical protein ALP74_00111 [Pseudomonas coronafaciens pv. garcae]RMS09572.1 hypothetical protein ALP72_00324 [Pseudomonas coronafaciens pv. coronafaciens]RMV95784.1 hypothetical protein ALP00_01311 [Pseudomonas coronafaciens pv. porri]
MHCYGSFLPAQTTQGLDMHWMILAAALAIGTTSQAASIYKWVDAQGVTHFDAQPPTDQQVQEINVQTPPPAAAPGTPSDDGAAQQRAIDQKVKNQVKAQEAQRAQSCETLRTNLAQLQNNPRVREQVGGESRRLTEDNRKTRIAETEKAISEMCR